MIDNLPGRIGSGELSNDVPKRTTATCMASRPTS